MATDQSPPKTELILLYVVLSILVLVALKFVLDSYFFSMSDEQYEAKINNQPAVDLVSVHKEQRNFLAQGHMSIAKAKRYFLMRGRSGFSAIAPRPSSDTRALQGWTQFGAGVPNPTLQPTQSESLGTGVPEGEEDAPLGQASASEQDVALSAPANRTAEPKPSAQSHALVKDQGAGPTKAASSAPVEANRVAPAHEPSSQQKVAPENEGATP